MDPGEHQPLLQPKCQSVTSRDCNKWRCCHYLCDPSNWPYRYIILALLCSLRFSFNFLYDTPASLESVVIELMRLDTTRYNLLYSAYSSAGILFGILGGLIIDRKLGIRLGLLIFAVIASIGQSVIVLGVVFDSYWVMLTGRFVLGLGCEIFLFAADAFATLWFKGRELNFVFGIIATVNRLGGSCGLLINQLLYQSFGSVSDKMLRLSLVFLVGLGLSFLSIVSSGTIFVMDKRAGRLLPEQCQPKKPFSLKDMKAFNVKFWLLIFVSSTYYASYYPLVTIGQLFYVNKYGLSVNLANIANVLMYLVTITAPLIGLVVNFVGFPIYWGLSALVLSIAMHTLFALSGAYWFIPFIGTSFLALTYSLFHTTIWPSLSLLVENHQLGTAFGIAYSFLDLSCAIVDIVIATIIDRGGYFLMETFLIVYQAMAVAVLVVVIVWIAGSNSRLDMSGWKARQLERKNKMEKSSSVLIN